MGEWCFQERPTLERVRNWCIGCLVLDCIFVLIYALTALASSVATPKTRCYEEHGYGWHTVVAFAFTASAMVAMSGATTHATAACAARITDRQLSMINKFAHVLVVWTFIHSLFEAIAYSNEPAECVGIGKDGKKAEKPQDGAVTRIDIEQVAYSFLWLAWVTGCVAVSMMSKRALVDLESEDSQPTQAQMVGMPVQFPPGGPSGSSVYHGASSAAFGSAVGLPPGSSSFPEPTKPWAQQGLGSSAHTNPTVVTGGVIVTQGRPVTDPSLDEHAPGR